MSSRKKRARATRPARASADHAELAALLSRPEVHAAPVASPDPAPTPPPGTTTLTIDEISAAVHYWGGDATDRSAAKVSGGFGPNACLVIEVLTLLTINRERAVSCGSTSTLGKVVGEALRAKPLLNPSVGHTDAATDAIA